jgi:hypothetical protein
LELCKELRNDIIPLIEGSDLFLSEANVDMTYPDFYQRFISRLRTIPGTFSPPSDEMRKNILRAQDKTN